MKSFIVSLFLVAAPLMVIGSSFPNTNATISTTETENAVVKSEPIFVESVAAAPASDKHSSTEAPPTTANPGLGQPKLNSLHRIPVFENRNPVIETIADFETHINNDTLEDNSQTNKTNLELPIPSRCPHITGTTDEELKKDGMLSLLESSRPKAAQRGCRFFIMHELIDRNQKHDEWALLTADQQMNQTLEKCYSSCVHAYDNGTELNDSCAEGCLKTSKVTEAVKDYLGPLDDDSESELEREQNVPSHRTFSIIIPIRPMNPSLSEKEDDEQLKTNSDAFPSMMPNAIKMMLNMMHQMTERARLSMMQPSHDGTGDQANGQSNIQESELSVDPSGNSISISRSMSVLMTKDKDGHSKMVVVHTIPKVLIHRFGQNSFGDENDDNHSNLDDLLSEPKEHSTSSSSSDDDDNDDLFGDNDQFRFKLFGHLSNSGSHNQRHTGHKNGEEDETSSSTTQVYYYRTRLCYYLPRLFYLTALILVLYVIFWLLCAVPQAILGGRASSNRRASPNGVAIIATATGGNGKCRKFLFTKSQKYFQLNNKRNSTTSLPPPYPGGEDNGSCAEPLPEKQPIPEGGLEVNTASNTNADK